MSKKKEITKYVEKIFNRYDANRYGFFCDYDEEQNADVEIHLFPFTKVDDATLERISVHLGITKEEIWMMDKKAAKRYWDKYPFFGLYQEFKDRWRWSARYKNTWQPPEERLLAAIFTENGVECNERYDYSSVTRRMIDNLKAFDKVLPGSYHTDAEITRLSIHTEVFFSFPQCTEMIRSFIDMVNRAKELFFMALSEELPNEDQNELNFLASWLNLCDIVMPSTLLTYNNVRSFRKAYLEENLNDFFSYGKIERDVSPWRCHEFFDDMALVQEYVNIFPQAKAKIRQFALDVTKFRCDFVWSDAKPIVFSPEEEAWMDYSDAVVGVESVPLEQREREHSVVYVDKTVDELFGWEENVRKLHAAAAPSGKGGLILPVRELPVSVPEIFMNRIQKRLSTQHGGAAHG